MVASNTLGSLAETEILRFDQFDEKTSFKTLKTMQHDHCERSLAETETFRFEQFDK